MNANEFAISIASFNGAGRYWLSNRERGLDLDLNHCNSLDDVTLAVFDCLTAGETVDRHGEPCDLETAWNGWRVYKA